MTDSRKQLKPDIGATPEQRLKACARPSKSVSIWWRSAVIFAMFILWIIGNILGGTGLIEPRLIPTVIALAIPVSLLTIYLMRPRTGHTATKREPVDYKRRTNIEHPSASVQALVESDKQR